MKRLAAGGALLLACLFAGGARAQTLVLTPTTENAIASIAETQVENPVVIDHWVVGILCPGLRFDLKGAAPAAVAAGSGVSFNYIFGRYIYTSPNGVQHPWFGVSLFAQGAVNVSPGSIASTTETAAVGAGIIILNYVVFGWIVDLLAGGANGPSGVLAGQMSLANTGPVVLTSIPLP